MKKITSFNEFINEAPLDAEYDFNHLELQARLNTLSSRKMMILRDEFDFPTIPTIDNIGDDELQRLHDVLNVYFFATLSDVIKEIDDLDDDEIDELGYFLSHEFLEPELSGSTEEDEFEDEFDKEEVIRMARVLCKEYHFIGFLMGIIQDGIPENLEQIDEAPSRIMKNKSMNKKKRKFMSKSASQLRREKSKRKRDQRQNKAKKKRYYKANKTKISAYQKSRSTAIKKGKHKVKKRRSA